MGFTYRKGVRRKARESLKAGWPHSLFWKWRIHVHLRRDAKDAGEVSAQPIIDRGFTSLFLIKEPWISYFESRGHEFQTASLLSTSNHYPPNILELSRLEYKNLDRKGLMCPFRSISSTKSLNVLLVVESCSVKPYKRNPLGPKSQLVLDSINRS